MYKALYRKYRPLTFDDVASQPHITETLQNQLISGKTAHAYMFTGSRGTGKTTCARIFAKAVNCENPVNGNPCLTCGICADAEENALSDIIEIDAASNSSVEDVRELREGAVYTPERCKYKIYIIDEVHMLSSSAFNALLKILEEPPPHVKFILATTDIHKVIPTILSRCQRFDFFRIKPADIADRLKQVAQKENITLEDDAAELIAKTADGGMRDALSLLDRCIAFSEEITVSTVSEAAGIAGREYLFEIMEAVTAQNAAKAVCVIDRLYSMSKDLQRLCDELIAQFRNVMMLKAAPENAGIIACMPGELEQLKNIAERLSLEDILSKLEILQKSNERLHKTPLKRVETEMCIIRLCSAAQLPTVTQAAPAPVYTPSAPMPAPAPAAKAQSAAPITSPATATTASGDLKPVYQWTEILERFARICPSVSGTLGGSAAYEQQNFLLIAAPNEFFIKLLRKKENAEKLQEAVRQVTGKTYNIRAKHVGGESMPLHAPALEQPPLPTTPPDEVRHEPSAPKESEPYIRKEEPPVSNPAEAVPEIPAPVRELLDKAEKNGVTVEKK